MSFEDAFCESVMKEEKSKEESLELLEDMLSSWGGKSRWRSPCEHGNGMPEAAKFPRDAGDKSAG